MQAELMTMVACLLLGQAPKPSPALKSAVPNRATSAAPKAVDAGADAPSENLEVRYARAQVKLAEANLQRMVKMNQRQAKSVPTTILDEYNQDIEVAKVRLDEALAGSTENVFHTWLRRAELAWQTAESSWKNGVNVNHRTPGTFASLDIDRFRLRADIARLQYERGLALEKASHEAQLQWEVDLLNGEVQRLKEQTTRIPVFSRFYPW